MSEADHLCALLRPLVSKHRYGAPLEKDEIVRQAAFEPHEEGAVRDAYEKLRELSFVVYHGDRGVMLDNSEFGRLADYLYETCNWPAWEIETKLKHYEGWDEHEWADDGL